MKLFLPILARNKEFCLPDYLNCIEKLDYDKSQIFLYINTNNNQDKTADMLKEWLGKVGHSYGRVLIEEGVINLPKEDKTSPHGWDSQRLKTLMRIRDRSLDIAREAGCEHYFVADCDNFITDPDTINFLIAEKKPVIAPMLQCRPVNTGYSNFWCDLTEHGWYKDHPDYNPIRWNYVTGTFKVPLVHCTYLIDMPATPKLKYDHGRFEWEFMTFSECCRDNGYGQFICNKKFFGILLNDDAADLGTLEKEAAHYKPHLDSYFRS